MPSNYGTLQVTNHHTREFINKSIGQDRNFEVSKVFIRDAIGCVVVCDAERKETLDNALKWKQKIDSSCDRVEDKPIPCILMQNKSDLLPKDGRQGFQNQENLVLTGVDAQFIGTSQVSAKTNTGIDAAMKTLIEAVTAFNAKKMIASKQNKSSSVEDSLKAGTKDEKKGPIKLNQQPKKSQEKSNCC